MALTINLDDELVAGLANKAMKQELSVEQLAISILTEAAREFESLTPLEAVARVQATPPNPCQMRSATANLADLLSSPGGEPDLDPEVWRRQWSAVEADLKAVTRANDVSEGRAG
jgi:hypothetical protein